MKEEFKLEVLDIFRMQTGHVNFLCTFDPSDLRRVTSESDAKIVVEDVLERTLNIVGENVFRTIKMRNENTIVITSIDNVDDIVTYLGKNKIYIKGNHLEGAIKQKRYLY